MCAAPVLRHPKREADPHLMPPPLRQLAALALILLGCIGTLMLGSPADLGKAELFSGAAIFLGVLLWVTRSDIHGQ